MRLSRKWKSSAIVLSPLRWDDNYKTTPGPLKVRGSNANHRTPTSRPWIMSGKPSAFLSM